MATAKLRVLPDTLRLLRRLAADRGLPRGVRVRVWLAAGYLAMPIDLIPDFIPVIGHADDVLVVAAVLRSVVRAAGPESVERHWPGTADGLGRSAGWPAFHREPDRAGCDSETGTGVEASAGDRGRPRCARRRIVLDVESRRRIRVHTADAGHPSRVCRGGRQRDAGIRREQSGSRQVASGVRPIGAAQEHPLRGRGDRRGDRSRGAAPGGTARRRGAPNAGDRLAERQRHHRWRGAAGVWERTDRAAVEASPRRPDQSAGRQHATARPAPAVPRLPAVPARAVGVRPDAPRPLARGAEGDGRRVQPRDRDRRGIHRSTVVNLFSVGVRAQRNGTYAGLVSGDGFHPSDAGHRAVARAFAAVYRRIVAE